MAPRAGTQWYSVPEAAERLGLKQRAVRKRIAAGTLLAERTAQGWRVALAAAPGPAQDQHTAGTPAPPNGTGPAPGTAELVNHLRGEVAFLRLELAELHVRHTAEIAAWQERLREAHLLAAQQLALPAPAPVPPRPEWRFWKR